MNSTSQKAILSLFSLFIALFFSAEFAFAQLPQFQSKSASQIQHELFKLQTLGSVLYVAAHPDDENTRLIAYYSNHLGARTTYLSLTRGDGGQNLIGKEQRELMGLIRTHELLAARYVDGGEQLFSRANDFGYSKTAEEALSIWDQEAVLADMVWAIRRLKPDLIITRFAPDYTDTHGHHIASAQLAVEAFKAASNPKKFPEQLKWVQVHQAKRILWNTSAFFFRDKPNLDKSGYHTLDIGMFNPLLGQHYGEIAAKSRSQHKSQGFGAAATRGEQIEYFKLLAGDSIKNNQLEEGIDMTWKRIAGGQQVETLLKKACTEFKPTEPHLSVPVLLQALTAMKQVPHSEIVAYKIDVLEKIILHCAGVWAEATSPEYSVSSKDSFLVQAPALMRYSSQVELVRAQLKISTASGAESHNFDVQKLKLNKVANHLLKIQLPNSLNNTHPYWLKNRATLGMYTVEDQVQRGLPENTPPFMVEFVFNVQGTSIALNLPVLHKWTDPVDGEIYRHLTVAPAATINFEQEAYTWPKSEERHLKMVVKAHQKNTKGVLQVNLPEGWSCKQNSFEFDIKEKFGEYTFYVDIKPPQKASNGIIKAEFKFEGMPSTEPALAYTKVEYKHIPIQILFPQAEAKLSFVPIQNLARKVGYIRGAGDDLPQALAQLGSEVLILDESQIKAEVLSTLDAVVLGVRAYNTTDFLRFKTRILHDYVQNGGVLVVQYNTNFDLVSNNLAPYMLKLSRERVTEENADVSFLEPEHKAVQKPNQIQRSDFDDWVQERGLYFPNEWASEFKPLLSMKDRNEPDRKGALLVAQHGKGYFVYTGLSLFRQLPANVAGAYKLLANLISLGR